MNHRVHFWSGHGFPLLSELLTLSYLRYTTNWQGPFCSFAILGKQR